MDVAIFITFVVALVATTTSAMSNGSGGFLAPPYSMLIGLTPLQAVATIKFATLGLESGSLRASRGKAQVHKKF